MKEAMSVLADLSTIATFIVTLVTLNKVQKIENRTKLTIDQSIGKDSESRTNIRQQIDGDGNIQIGRDANG